MDNEQKVLENRLRRMAERRGLRLEKSRRRDPAAPDFGTYQLIDDGTNAVVSHDGGPLTLDQVKAQLFGGGSFHRAAAGEHVDAEAGSVITIKAGTVVDIAATGRKFVVQEDGTLRPLSDDEMTDELAALAE